MKLSLKSQSVEQTQRIGSKIGESLTAGAVIGLDGTLGAGKTHLVKGIASGLGISEAAIVSPTYTICIPYDARLPLLHLDAYRIQSPEEVDELGLDELVDNGAVLVVEWASTIENLLPPIDLRIKISQTDEHERELLFESSKKPENVTSTDIGEKLISALKTGSY
jgi:tRNA threonylcarbamoyladenosine biosynthesis protein TsaE